MNCFCILLACFLNLLTPLRRYGRPQTRQSGMQGSLSRAHSSAIDHSHPSSDRPITMQCPGQLQSVRRLEWNQTEPRGDRGEWQGWGWAERRGWLWSMSQSAPEHLGLEEQLENTDRATQNGLKMRARERDSPFGRVDASCVHRHFVWGLRFTK